ncbi:hypothetical protein N9242_06090 [Vicingaceae bacterium]|nr:hypothetical protein [Vicingaceae bacterium]
MKFRYLNRFSNALVVAVLSFLGVINNVSAQDELPDAKDLIKSYLIASGGEEKMRNVKSVVTKGKMSIPNAPAELDLEVFQVDGKFLFRIDFQPLGELKFGTDGKTVWEMGPENGNRIMTGNERADTLRDNAHPFPEISWLKNYDGDYKTVGKGKVDGKVVYEVEFTPKEGTKSSRFFEEESGMIVKAIKKQNDKEIEIFPSDFRDVDGIKLPHKQTLYSNNDKLFELKMESISFNEKIDDDKFSLPVEIKKLVKDDK